MDAIQYLFAVNRPRSVSEVSQRKLNIQSSNMVATVAVVAYAVVTTATVTIVAVVTATVAMLLQLPQLLLQL